MPLKQQNISIEFDEIQKISSKIITWKILKIFGYTIKKKYIIDLIKKENQCINSKIECSEILN